MQGNYIYINIPCFGNWFAVINELFGQINNNDIINNVAEINYVFVGTPPTNPSDIPPVLINNPFTKQLIPHLPTTNDITDSTAIITEIYKTAVENYEYNYNILFINIYDIVNMVNTNPSAPVTSIPQITPPLQKNQRNWINYIGYFYINNYLACLGHLTNANAVGIDLQETIQPLLPFYLGNNWWSNSVYIQTLYYGNSTLGQYENKKCTTLITNGIIGGLFISLWNSGVNWTYDSSANTYEIFLYNNTPPFNETQISLQNGYVFQPSFCFKPKPHTPDVIFPDIPKVDNIIFSIPLISTQSYTTATATKTITASEPINTAKDINIIYGNGGYGILNTTDDKDIYFNPIPMINTFIPDPDPTPPEENPTQPKINVHPKNNKYNYSLFSVATTPTTSTEKSINREPPFIPPTKPTPKYQKNKTHSPIRTHTPHQPQPPPPPLPFFLRRRI